MVRTALGGVGIHGGFDYETRFSSIKEKGGCEYGGAVSFKLL